MSITLALATGAYHQYRSYRKSKEEAENVIDNQDYDQLVEIHEEIIEYLGQNSDRDLFLENDVEKPAVKDFIEFGKIMGYSEALNDVDTDEIYRECLEQAELAHRHLGFQIPES